MTIDGEYGTAMIYCPKCGRENLPDRLDCQRCGVIFAKVRQGLAPQVPVPVEPVETATAVNAP